MVAEGSGSGGGRASNFCTRPAVVCSSDPNDESAPNFLFFIPFFEKIHKYVPGGKILKSEPLAWCQLTLLGAIVADAEILGSTQTWR